MSTLSTLKNHASLIRNHPALVTWYARNRARLLSLTFDRRRADGTSRFPRGITIKPTLACNLRCKMCGYASSGEVRSNPRGDIGIEAWEALVQEVSSFHPYISLTGGEPLLYPGLHQLLQIIKTAGLVCTLTTNGMLLPKRAEELMQNPPDVLIVSLDGPSEVHDEIRGVPGSYARAAEGIHTIHVLKQKTGQKRPFVIINCAITSFNYAHVEEMADIARELGVNVLNFQHQWSLTQKMVDAHNRMHGDVHHVCLDEVGEIDLPAVEPKHVSDAVGNLRRQAHTSNGGMYITFYPELNDGEVEEWYSNPHKWVRRSPAVCAWLNTDILPNGDVEPCPGLVCGNITESKFGDAWNGEEFRAHRRRLLEHGDFPICVRCCAYLRRD